MIIIRLAAACLALLLATDARAAFDLPTPDGNRAPVESRSLPNDTGQTISVFASGTPTQSSVSCANTSTQLLAAGAAQSFVRIIVPSTAPNSVWFNWTGAAATTAPPSDEIAPGNGIAWIAASGFLPTSRINCIASQAVTVTVTSR